MRPLQFSLTLAAVIVFSTLSALAWTGPTSAPPNGNVEAPVNVSATAQTKSGSLGILDNLLLGASGGSYLNFGATSGSDGYGIRDNSGTLEFKSTGGSWASLNTSVQNSLTLNGVTTNGTGGVTQITFGDGTTQTTALPSCVTNGATLRWSAATQSWQCQNPVNAPKTVFLTSGTTWSVPSDWNSSNNTIECLGPGGAGFGSSVGGGGGGGGAYAAISNLTLTPGGTATYQIGSPGSSDTWISNTGSTPGATTEGCLAKRGNSAGSATGATGGSSASSVGTTKNSGGSGGDGTNAANGGGGGGGGAAGPSGVGKNGGTAATRSAGGGGGSNGGSSTVGADAPDVNNGGNGGNGTAGAGSGAGGGPSLAGSNGSSGGGGGGGGRGIGGTPTGGTGGSSVVWTATAGGTAGPGGGAGGAGGNNTGGGVTGGTGGTYGGGAGGGGDGPSGNGTGGSAGAGIIVITYTP